MSIPVNKLGWVAGVIDTKGKIVRKNNKTRATPQIVLKVETKESHIVGELCSLTGIQHKVIPARSPQDWMRRGCIEHCPEKHVHVPAKNYDWQMPEISVWSITGAGAAVVLTNIIPFLLSRQTYETVLNEIIENATVTGQGSMATSQSVRRLYDLGWEIPNKLATVMENVILQ